MLSGMQGPQKTKLQETLAALSQEAKGPAAGGYDERADKSPDNVNEAMYEQIVVGRCKLDPGLKATCFQTLNLRVNTLLST